MNPESKDAIKKTLEALSVEDLDTVIKMANEIKIIKDPFYKIKEDCIILNVETNDISQLGNTFRSDDFTYTVKSTWQIKSKIHELLSVTEGWMSHGDSEITTEKMKWITKKPNKAYSKIAEYIAKKMSKSYRATFDKEMLEELLERDEELKKMVDAI